MNNNIKHIASIISPYNRGEKILLSILSNLKEEKKVKPIPVLFNALKKLAPALKVLPQIRAGRTIFLSAYISEKSSLYYATRWCLNSEGVNHKLSLDQRITADLLDALQNTGRAYALKKELDQSVINSRVNAKAVYRGKFKKKRKGIKRIRRVLRAQRKALGIRKRSRVKFKSKRKWHSVKKNQKKSLS